MPEGHDVTRTGQARAHRSTNSQYAIAATEGMWADSDDWSEIANSYVKRGLPQPGTRSMPLDEVGVDEVGETPQTGRERPTIKMNTATPEEGPKPAGRDRPMLKTSYPAEGTEGQVFDQIVQGAADIAGGGVDAATHPLALGAIAGYYGAKKKFTGRFTPGGKKDGA